VGIKRHAHHLEHLRRDRRTENGGDRTPPVPVTCCADRDARIDGEVKPHMWMEQRERAHDILDRGDLGRVALQELQTGGHIAEQVAHLESDAGQQRAGSLFDLLPRTDSNRRASA
jgi:hypothetical protein